MAGRKEFVCHDPYLYRPGTVLVADVNSGAVHVLDRMSYDLLSLLEKEETMGRPAPVRSVSG